MPVFGKESLAQLATCDPRLQRVMNEAIKIYDFSVIEGYRNQADQDADFRAGKTQLKFPHGKHNHRPSLACDIAPYPIDWSDAPAAIQRFVLCAGIIIATGYHLKIPIRYGGDWNMDGDTRDEKFRDYGHFELRDP